MVQGPWSKKQRPTLEQHKPLFIKRERLYFINKVFLTNLQGLKSMAQGPGNLTGLHEHLERTASILTTKLNTEEFQHVYNVLINLASQFSFGERPVLLPKKLHDCLEAHRKKIDPTVKLERNLFSFSSPQEFMNHIEDTLFTKQTGLYRMNQARPKPKFKLVVNNDKKSKGG